MRLLPRLLLFLVLILVSLIFPSSVKASLIRVTPQGEVVWNVLAQEDSITLKAPANSYIEVKKVADEKVNSTPAVSLARRNGAISLYVSSEKETRELNIPQEDRVLIEIEERPETQTLTLGIKGDKFSLEQKNVTALTTFPVSIDPISAKLAVTTSSGNEFLSVLPLQAIESVLRTKLVTEVSRNVEVLEEADLLQYKIEGQKIFNILNLYNYSIPVTAYVSASTGELTSIDSPTWFRFVKFLFI